jgi:glutathione-regulated potassium-efflux system ancillary protein KefC
MIYQQLSTTKYILFLLFALGGLALWLVAKPCSRYLIGMVLAGTVGKDLSLIRRLRTLTFGFLTPFYFIRAGSFVSVPALLASPVVLLVLFSAKMLTKIVPCSLQFAFTNMKGQRGFITRS